jgi:octaprenyl-diphosphate synthase
MSKPTLANSARAHRATSLPMALVADDLYETERIFDETLDPFRDRFTPIVNHLKHYRGKRLRPILLLLAGHACGKVSRAHHVLGAVVEMIHTATLVHDDVLDAAETRRHVRTVNSVWGSQTSLLLGDMLFSAAFRLCSTVDATACEWIGAATNHVCAGELLQVSLAGDLDIDVATYLEIVGGKTAALTECCTRLGARCAGAGLEVVSRLAEFGRHLGAAFQIADDILDVNGDEHIAGKTLGTDAEQQKLTLPVIQALTILPAADADRLRAALRRGCAASVAELVVAAGTIESAEREARRLAAAARRALSILEPSPYRSALEHVADWAVRRER